MRYVVFFSVVLAASAVLPCDYEDGPSLLERGPSQWDGRDDVPSNWMFVSRDRSSQGISWWQQKRPDGEVSRLIIEHGDGLIRVFPENAADIGATYEVFSVRNDDPALSREAALLQKAESGSFAITEPLDSPPEAPELLETEIVHVSEPPNSCFQDGQDHSFPTFLLRVHESHSAFVLRNLENGRVLDGVTDVQSLNRRLTGREYRTSDALSYRLEAFDMAGNTASRSGVVFVDRGISCSSSAFPHGNRSSPHLAVLGLILLLGLCRCGKGAGGASEPRRV